jgi:hypothetical protein
MAIRIVEKSTTFLFDIIAINVVLFSTIRIAMFSETSYKRFK